MVRKRLYEKGFPPPPISSGRKPGRKKSVQKPKGLAHKNVKKLEEKKKKKKEEKRRKKTESQVDFLSIDGDACMHVPEI